VNPTAGSGHHDESAVAVLLYDARNPAFLLGGAGYVAFDQARAALRTAGMLQRCSWQAVIRGLRSDPALAWLTDRLLQKYGLTADLPPA
jgi:hypothetical protein